MIFVEIDIWKFSEVQEAEPLGPYKDLEMHSGLWREKKGECNINSTSYTFGDIPIKAFLCGTLMISAFHNLSSIPVILHYLIRQSPEAVYFVAGA